MKHLILLIIAIAALTPSHVSAIDFKTFFAHPDTQIITQFGKFRSRTVPFQNHSNPKNPKEAPVFQSGWEADTEDRPDKPGVFWRFIQKTEYGDLYLFTVQQAGAVTKAFPVLYDGSELIAYQHDGIKVTIQPRTDEY